MLFLALAQRVPQTCILTRQKTLRHSDNVRQMTGSRTETRQRFQCESARKVTCVIPF